jgi:predicted amino acid-binding ACT domain protein
MLPDPVTDGVSADRYILTVSGPDYKGALRTITRRLAQEGIDIFDLHAIRDDATMRISAFMELVSPLGVDVLSIVHDLQSAAAPKKMLLTLQHRALLQATSRPESPPRVA